MGFGLRGALTNLLALSEFIMSLLTYQKVFVLWPNIGCSLTENFVNFSTPRPDGRRADAVTFPLPPPAPSATSVLLPSDIMSGGASEEDLDDVDIPEDEYLFEIVERAPASSSLLNVMREMPICGGVFAECVRSICTHDATVWRGMGGLLVLGKKIQGGHCTERSWAHLGAIAGCLKEFHITMVFTSCAQVVVGD